MRPLKPLLAAALCVGTGIWSLGGRAHAADKSIYNLINPTPDAALRDFSPDRPLNAFSPFTLDAGRVQIESDLANVLQSRDHGATTTTWQTADPEFRVGLTPSLEMDVFTAGLMSDRTVADASGRVLERDVGTGAVTLQARYNLFGNDGGKAALALAPFIALPSGDPQFGNQRVIGGVVAPLSLKLPNDFTLDFQSEVQAMRIGTGPAFASFTNVANLSHPVPGADKLTASIELTSVVNADHKAPDTATVETAIAYLITPDTQVDLGGFVGLNRAAPEFQVAGGVSHRF